MKWIIILIIGVMMMTNQVCATLDNTLNEYEVISKTGDGVIYDVGFKKVMVEYDDESSLWEKILDFFRISDIDSYKLESTEICMEAEFEGEYPETLEFYKTQELIQQDDIEIEELEIKDDKYKVKFCYIANPLEDYYLKFGSNSIIIIKITGANHLNSTKGFVQDIYNYVNETDGITYTIPNQEYVRAYFKANLTNENWIDFVTNNTIPANLSIYEEDGNISIGDVYNITQGHYYIQVNHTGNQSVFDLRSSGNITYDFINDAPPQPPGWSASLDDNPDPIWIPEVLTYSATGDDPDNDQYYLVICSTDSIDENTPSASGTCDTGVQYCTSGTTFDTEEASCDYTTQVGDEGNFVAYGFLCDDTGRCSASQSSTTLIYEEDTTYPQFSDYWDDNATLTENGTGHFNVTVENTNGTVLLGINTQWHTTTNLTSNVYNASAYLSYHTCYGYNWRSYSNGTNENMNMSPMRYYCVLEEEEEDSCTYTSGTWYINCSDNCSINEVDLGGNNIEFSNTGDFTFNNLLNVRNITLPTLCNLIGGNITIMEN